VLRSSRFTASASLRSSAGVHGARGSSSSGTVTSGLPPPPVPPSSKNGSLAALSYTGRSGKPLPRASSLPPTPLPSSFPLSSSSLAVDRAKSPSGGGGQGVAGAVGFIGRRPRVSRQMDGDDLRHPCPRARGAHQAREVGASAMGGAAPCPHDAVTGKMQRERDKVRERRG
jgi:hypothetical protein